MESHEMYGRSQRPSTEVPSVKLSDERLRPEQDPRNSRSVYAKVFPYRYKPPPSPESPGVSEWLQTYLSALLTVSVFGGSISFTVIVQSLQDPKQLPPSSRRANFSIDTVRLFITLAWMFFTFSFGIAAIALVLYNNESMKYVPRQRWGFVDFMIRLMLPILSLCPILAFACLALAVAAYAPVVGWFVLGWIGLYFMAVSSLIFYVNFKGVSFLIIPEDKDS